MFARPALALSTLLLLILPGYLEPELVRAESSPVVELEQALAQPASQTEFVSESNIEPEAQVAVAAPEPNNSACKLPLPTGRWSGRDSDDEWARGLYPHGDDYGGALALTFDDGPHRSRTPLVLDELKRHDMHATFFITGHSVRSGTYDLVQRMVAEGHALANHGWRHDTNMASLDGLRPAELEAYVRSEFELTQIRVDLALIAESPEHFIAMHDEVFAGLRRGHERHTQLARMPQLLERHRALLQRHGFGEGEHPYVLDYVRPPGGNPYLGGRWSTREREIFARAINDMGLTMVMWNAGSGDSNTHLSPSERRDPERVAESARRSAAKGGIYIAHDRIEPGAMQAMIAAFASSGVEIVSLHELEQRKLGC